MWHVPASPGLRLCPALLLLAAWSDLAAGADDLLILRDGSRRVGRLQVCVNDRCTLNGQGLPREQIEWIGLKDPGTVPPAVRDASDDEVHLRDGTVRSGALVGISASVVLTERGSLEREDVAWIHLIAGSAELDGGTEIAEEPSPPPPSPPPQPSPPPMEDEDPAPTPSPSTDRRIEDPPPGKPPGDPPRKRKVDPPPRPGDAASSDLWIGEARGDLHITTRDDHPDCRSQGDITGANFARYTTTLRVRLRETKRQPLSVIDRKAPGGFRIVAQIVELTNEGTAVESGFESSYPTANPNCRPSSSCSDRATTRFSDGDNPGGYLMYRTVEEPVRQNFPGLGEVEVPKEGLYQLRFDTIEKWAPCPKPGYSGYVQPPDHGYMIQNDPLMIGTGDPAGVFSDPERRLLTPNRSRMIGSYTQVHTSADSRSRLNVRWDICRAGTPGCKIEPVDLEKKDDCGEMAAMSPQMSALRSQRDAMAAKLAEDWKKLEQANAELEFNKAAWRTAIAACAIFDIVSETLGSVTGNFGEAVGRLGDVIDGDYLGAGAGDEIGLLFDAYGNAFPAGPTAGKVANLRAKLGGCSGLPENLRKGAEAFVDNFEKVGQLMPQVQRQVFDIKQKDQQFWDEAQKNTKNCLEWAECMKLDPSVCDPAR